MADAQETNSVQADIDKADTERTQLLDDMERLQDDGTLAEEETSEETEEETEEESEEEDKDDSEEGESEEEEDDDSEEDEDSNEDETEEEEEKPDDDADKVKAERLEAVRVAEQRAKASIAEERSKLDTERATMAEQVAAVAEFDKLKRLAASDPVAVFRTLVGDDLDLEYTSHQFFLEGKGKDDSKYSAKAKELARMRGNSTENAELRAEIQEIRDERAAEKTHAQQEESWTEYLDNTVATLENLNGEAPLLRTWAKNAPKSVRAQMRKITEEHFEATGDTPSPEQIITALEKVRHTMLTEQGIDPQTVGEKTDKKTKSKQDAKTKSKAKKKKPKKPAKSEPEELTRDEMIAAMEKFEEEPG